MIHHQLNKIWLHLNDSIFINDTFNLNLVFFRFDDAKKNTGNFGEFHIFSINCWKSMDDCFAGEVNVYCIYMEIEMSDIFL